jgi:hypothetical protein
MRIQKSLRGSRSAPGVLNHKHVHARLVRDNSPFRGRVALNRGVGVIEFPTVEQFRRIARDEGVPQETVERSFGPARATSRKKPRATSRTRGGVKRPASARRKSSRRVQEGRRSSRQIQKPGILSQIFGLQPNTTKIVRRDYIFVPTKLDGTTISMLARTENIPDEEVTGFGAEKGIRLSLGSQVVVLPYQHAALLAADWVSKHDFFRAFGHLKRRGVLGITPRQVLPVAFGPRSMKLGHYSEGVRETDKGPVPAGEAMPGIVKGHLVLFHRPTGSVVWSAFDDEGRNPKKPILIRLPYRDGSGYKQINVPINKAFSGAKIGTGDKSEMVGAVDRGIPPMAMLTAFDHLLTQEQRRQAYETFSQPGPDQS